MENISCDPNSLEIFSQYPVRELDPDTLIVFFYDNSNVGVCIDREDLLRYYDSEYLYGNCSGNTNDIETNLEQSCQKFYKYPATNVLFHAGVKELIEHNPHINKWRIRPNQTTAVIGSRRHVEGEMINPEAQIATICSIHNPDLCAPPPVGSNIEDIDFTWLNQMLGRAIINGDNNEVQDIMSGYEHLIDLNRVFEFMIQFPDSLDKEDILDMLNNGVNSELYIDMMFSILSTNQYELANYLLIDDYINELNKTLFDFIRDLNVGAVEWLVEDSGADPNMIDVYRGRGTPLIYATQFHGNAIIDIANVLIDNDANVNQVYIDKNPLIMAIENDNRPLFYLLIENGANVNQKLPTDMNNSILHKAAEHGDKIVVRSLLLSGADPFMRNNLGEYPYMVASNTELGNYIRQWMNEVGESDSEDF